MVKIYRKLTDKGTAIRFQIDLGLTNAKISRKLGICESLVRYYRQRPEKLEVKKADEIFQPNKATRKMSLGLIAIKINNKLKKAGVLDRKGRLYDNFQGDRNINYKKLYLKIKINIW